MDTKRILDTEYWILLDTEWILTGYWMDTEWILDTGYWILDTMDTKSNYRTPNIMPNIMIDGGRWIVEALSILSREKSTC